MSGSPYMSPSGHSRPSHRGPKCTFVRCYSNSGQTPGRLDCPLSAKSGLMHCNKRKSYSITSSAICWRCSGTVRPSAFAVLRLITNSNLVDCTTGRSAGFSPLENSPNVNPSLAIRARYVGSVAHQTASGRKLSKFIYRGNHMTSRQHDELLALAQQEWIAGDNKAIRPLLDEGRKCWFKVALIRGVNNVDLLSNDMSCLLRVFSHRLGIRIIWVYKQADYGRVWN